MDIASMSMAFSQMKVMQQTSVAVAKKTLDVTEDLAAGLIKMLQGQGPQFGQTLDIRA